MYRSRILIFIVILCCLSKMMAANGSVTSTQNADTFVVEQTTDNDCKDDEKIEMGYARQVRTIVKKAPINSYNVVLAEIPPKRFTTKKKIEIKGVFTPIHQIVCVYRE